MRLLPVVAVAVLAITVYAIVLRRRLRTRSPFAGRARDIRSRATLAVADAADALDAAERGLPEREARDGADATLALTQAISATRRDRDDVVRVLDLVGAGRDDLDAMLDGAADRALASAGLLRRVRRAADVRARAVASPAERLAAVEVFAAELRRGAEERGGVAAGLGPGPSRADRAHALRLLDAAVAGCARGRESLDRADAARAAEEAAGAEAVADDAARLLDGPFRDPSAW